jgi:hypothetical protein
VSLLLLASCGGGAVDVQAPSPQGKAATDCRALVGALPAHVADQKRRDVSPSGAPAAAWGDPAIVLRCGVPKPAGLDKFASCQVTDGVGWYIPESQITGAPTDVTMTTVGREAYVEVRLPRDYFPPAAAMVDLAKAIKKTVPQLRPCL